MADPRPSVAQGVLKRPFVEQVAFFRNKLGDLVPTARWDDLLREQHDAAFMVAGAAKADLLQDLVTAVDRAISEGKSIQAFRQDFRAIVARRGWHGWTGEGSAAGERWRTRVIYQTNAATSYSAGRLAQLREGGFPLWVYRHSETAENPRPQHLAWNGLTLPSDHPFWRTHYPPSGWGCGCYVLGARSEAAAKRLGGQPGKALPPGWDQRASNGLLPGIDKGWDYQPGATVAEAVQQVAAKATQWEDDLTRATMQALPPAQRDALAVAYRSLPSVQADARRYAQRILEGRTHLDIPPYRTLGSLTRGQVQQAAAVLGELPAGIDWSLGAEAVRRIGELELALYRQLPPLLDAALAIEPGPDAGTLRVRARLASGAALLADFRLDGERLLLIRMRSQ